MKTLTVNTGQSYKIRIGEGALQELGSAVNASGAARVVAVTDENVWRLHGAALEAVLQAAGRPWHPVVLAPGEASKSFAVLERICGELVDRQFGRGDLLVAFGGGVVGDVCGFAAAVYMRGVRYIQVPTTLLAQVDSSVGGKTAVNIPQGKNLVGAFYQPQTVLIDTGLLRTLPEREWKSGMAEVIKYGAIASRELFDTLMRLTRADSELLEDVILECCRLKSEVVAEDELDLGRRMLLNFGHTFGHAIETLGGFAAHTHGEGVAIGMTLAAQAGKRMGKTPAQAVKDLRALLARHGLQCDCPYPAATLLPLMLSDKKSEAGRLRLVLLDGIGKADVHTVSAQELGQLLAEMDVAEGG